MGVSLAAITSSHVPTTIVVRDRDRAERIRQSGVRVSGKIDSLGRPQVVASIEELSDFGPEDLLFIATKTTAITDVCRTLGSIFDQMPFVVSYQNGIESGRSIIGELGSKRVARMVLIYGAALVEREAESGPVQAHVGLHAPPHYVGGEGAIVHELSRELARSLTNAGLPTEFSDDIEREVWRKGIANAAGNPVAAIVRAPLGELMNSPARSLIKRLLDEGIGVAQAVGIKIGDSYKTEALAPMLAGGRHLPSMAQDVMAGRQTEITQLNEQIVERARDVGVPVPTHEAIIDLIRTFEWRYRNT
jgi:2-dehydropantoate 2-reductase